jgi:hypothetical protein
MSAENVLPSSARQPQTPALLLVFATRSPGTRARVMARTVVDRRIFEGFFIGSDHRGSGRHGGSTRISAVDLERPIIIDEPEGC